MPAGFRARTSRAACSVSKPQNTQAPEPVMRASPNPASQSRLRATSGCIRQTTGSRSFLPPKATRHSRQPVEKAAILMASVFRVKSGCGEHGRGRNGDRRDQDHIPLGRQLRAPGAARRPLRRRHCGRTRTPARRRRAAAPAAAVRRDAGQSPQAVERDQRGGRVRAAAAQAAAQRQALLHGRGRRRAACRLRCCSRRAARTHQIRVRGHCRPRSFTRRITPSARTVMPMRSPQSMKRKTVCSS